MASINNPLSYRIVTSRPRWPTYGQSTVSRVVTLVTGRTLMTTSRRVVTRTHTHVSARNAVRQHQPGRPSTL